MNAATSPLLSIDGFEPNTLERWVIHSALLAQVDDMHAGGVYSWGEEHLEAAQRVVSVLTDTPLGEAPESYGKSVGSKVIVASILVVLYDLDHPDLASEEWAEAERLISLMAPEFGR